MKSYNIKLKNIYLSNAINNLTNKMESLLNCFNLQPKDNIVDDLVITDESAKSEESAKSDESAKTDDFVNLENDYHKMGCSTEIINLLNNVVIDKTKINLYFPFYGNQFVKIVSIYDADTIKVLFIYCGNPVITSVRIEGIDSAEIKSKHPIIKQFAAETRDYLKELISENFITTAFFKKWDKYGGRVIGSINIGEANIASILLSTMMVVKYDGKTKMSDDNWLEFINNNKQERSELQKKFKNEYKAPF